MILRFLLVCLAFPLISFSLALTLIIFKSTVDTINGKKKKPPDSGVGERK
ncbi:MAG: hypothetical protein LKF42_09105 [Streptococcaceae bacterium]|jgi:hypothetical protein|nr:hypothetical protein [Streptococcaceae bacterium]